MTDRKSPAKAPAAPPPTVNPSRGSADDASPRARADRSARPTSITIAQGETLAATAKRAGVDADALFAANRDVIGSNPERAVAGTALVVPQED